mmetsp:Transcript_8190/g.21835  ORF Transcript_8190/g.21835 Transcript_8190/m.21835 type:complete len:236 (-) Transcript_8190:1606-2313(-)
MVAIREAARTSLLRICHTSSLFSTMGGNTTFGRICCACSAVSRLTLRVELGRELRTVLAVGPTLLVFHKGAGWLAAEPGAPVLLRKVAAGGEMGGSVLLTVDLVPAAVLASSPSIACSMSLSNASEPCSSALYRRVRLPGCKARFWVMPLITCSSFSSLSQGIPEVATLLYSNVLVPSSTSSPFLATIGCALFNTLMFSSAENTMKYRSCCASRVVMSRSYAEESSGSSCVIDCM